MAKTDGAEPAVGAFDPFITPSLKGQIKATKARREIKTGDWEYEFKAGIAMLKLLRTIMSFV